MKITVQINNKPVEIELTEDQVKTVKKNTDKITDRVKTFEDACEVLGISSKGIDHPVDKLKTIVVALNEGWTPDWTNYGQYKYVPYFEWQNGRFVFGDYSFWGQGTDVGSRLCFKSSELAEYCAKQFEDLYNEFLG